jgi:hypothetical protein
MDERNDYNSLIDNKENNQTAVEWLIQELGEYFPHEIGGIHLMVEKAKQMEKEQMFEFAEQVLKNTECSFTGLPFMTTGYDNIYEETYGK